MSPRPDRVPITPLLTYFQSPLFKGPKGKDWGAKREAEANKWLAEPAWLADMFAESAQQFENAYRNYQPFYPTAHTFGFKGATGVKHGERLDGTVDVAKRLDEPVTWEVPNNRQLDFVYIDREIALARSKPAPEAPAELVKSTLLVDLFLANARDRMPILCEVKLRKDQCAFYALIQLLTQATYACSPSQRERLVLFGSRPGFVLQETAHGSRGKIDLYVMLVEPPDGSPHAAICSAAIELGARLLKDERVAARIRRLAWLKGQSDGNEGLTFEALTA